MGKKKLLHLMQVTTQNLPEGNEENHKKLIWD